MVKVKTRHKSAGGREAGMLRFNCMESILFNCPEYSVMTLSLSRTHIPIDWPETCLETSVPRLTLLS